MQTKVVVTWFSLLAPPGDLFHTETNRIVSNLESEFQERQKRKKTKMDLKLPECNLTSENEEPNLTSFRCNNLYSLERREES